MTGVGGQTAVRLLRVLYYNHSADVSGAEISLLLTVDHMSNVNAVLAAPEGELLARARERGMAVNPVKGYRARMSVNPLVVVRGLAGSLVAGLEFRRAWRTHRPHVVHANSIRSGIIASLGLVGCRVPVVWHIRDDLPNNVVGRAIRRLALWQADRAVAISQAIAENFATGELLRRKTVVVHNGIDASDSEPVSLRGLLGVPGNRFVVGVVGQIARWKRQHDAIAAFSRLCGLHPDSELWLVGAPKFREDNFDYERELRAQADVLGVGHRIRFLGFRDDVDHVMHSLDVLLLPSDNEPFGRVIIEAMRAGRPVVATNAGGVPEIVVDGETGYLVPVGGVDAMVEALRRLAAQPRLREEMGERARLRVAEHFTIEATARGVRAVYDDVIRIRPHGSV